MAATNLTPSPQNFTQLLSTTEANIPEQVGPGDAVWILTSAFIIFTMISGFGLVESGMVSKKNETNIMVKNALDVIFGGLSYWMFGFALSRGETEGYENPFSGTGNFFTDATHSKMGSVFALYFFQASFATTATTIVSGAIAERANLQAYMVFSFTNTLAFCFPAHWVWGKRGWLKNLGVIDVGGASPVHLVGGVAGLVGTIMLKPRRNKFGKNATKLKMASPTNVLLGTFMLWWGWLGFNCGSTFGVSGGKWKLASRSAVCTLNASIGGGIFAHLFGCWYFKRVDIPTLMSGILGSLVSITAICAVARPGESIIIGFVGSVISVLGWLLLEKLKIDDPVGAIPTHAGSALWGMLAVGLFVEQDRLEDFSETYGVFKGGHIQVLGVQLLACIVIGLWSATLTFIQIFVIGRFIHFRFSDYEERVGADYCEHGVDHSTERQTIEEQERARATLARSSGLEQLTSHGGENEQGPTSITAEHLPRDHENPNLASTRKRKVGLFRSVGLALGGFMGGNSAREQGRSTEEGSAQESDDGKPVRENKTAAPLFKSTGFAFRGFQQRKSVVRVKEAKNSTSE